VPVAWLFSGSDSIRDGLDVVERYDAEALHPPKSMIAGTSLFDGEAFEDVDLVDAASSMDKAVNVWTVRSWYEAEQLQDAGVDGLISDYDGVQRYGAGAVRVSPSHHDPVGAVERRRGPATAPSGACTPRRPR